MSSHIPITKMEVEGEIPKDNNGDPEILPENQRLKGKVVVITGAARGIGGATATLFARHGAHVVIADILDDLGTALAQSINGRYIHCDVSDESAVESAVNLAVSWKGRLDVMFNNAGIGGPSGSITALSMADVTKLLAVNVLGMVHGIKHASRAMMRTNTRGSIICTSSSAALMGGLASHPYTTSKEAIIGLARSAACELGAHGIRVNCVSPHGVPSEMLVSAYRMFMGKGFQVEEVTKAVAERGSLLKGRAACLEDVARAALFLASEEDSGFITGHNLVLDGGYTSACNYMTFIYQ